MYIYNIYSVYIYIYILYLFNIATIVFLVHNCIFTTKLDYSKIRKWWRF